MDRTVPEGLARILYLCGAIEPQREGISKELFLLHRHNRKSFVVGTSPDGGVVTSREQRYVGIPSKLLPFLRYGVRLIERRFDLLHIFQGMDCYHYLKVKGSRPIVLTAISIENILSMDHYRRVRMIVVECNRDREKLLANGFNPAQVKVIYPGSDLSVFNDNVPPPTGRFRILFASSPFSMEYMEPRGVRLMLEAAKLKTDVEFVLLWRKRGDTLGQLQQWIGELDLKNITVINEDIEQMNRMFVETHATIVPFTSDKHTKSCPNSAIESLATGRPVLLSDKVGIADIVKEGHCGKVFTPEVSSLVAAINDLQHDYVVCGGNARSCAVWHFDETVFISSYMKLYSSILCEDA